MYIERQIEATLKQMMTEFPAIFISGARQVGKSTLLMMIKPDHMKYVTLDDIDARSLAISDPKYFMDFYGAPLFIDEIQKAPELLNLIKIKIDEQRLRCLQENKKEELLFFVTGSHQFSIMKSITESLAGRIGILNLFSLSLAEINGSQRDLFIPSNDYLRHISHVHSTSTKDLFERIYKGGMPDYIVNAKSRDMFFSSYIDTYINRDIKDLLTIGKTIEFYHFMQYLAVRTSQELDHNSIAKAIGVDATTIKRWISTLQASGIIFLLHPYSTNVSNRIIKTPKLYFMDTGLCTYLAKWPNAETLEVGAISGAIFETYVISEIVKNYVNHGIDPHNYLYYYRDKDQKEIDLLYIDATSITPIEIKKGISPTHPDRNFSVLMKYNLDIRPGVVICMTDSFKPINRNCFLCPVELI